MKEQPENGVSVQGSYGNSAPPAASYGGPSSSMGAPAAPGYHSNYQQYGYDNYYQQPPAPPPHYSGVSCKAQFLYIVLWLCIQTDFIVTAYYSIYNWRKVTWNCFSNYWYRAHLSLFLTLLLKGLCIAFSVMVEHVLLIIAVSALWTFRVSCFDCVTQSLCSKTCPKENLDGTCLDKSSLAVRISH